MPTFNDACWAVAFIFVGALLIAFNYTPIMVIMGVGSAVGGAVWLAAIRWHVTRRDDTTQ